MHGAPATFIIIFENTKLIYIIYHQATPLRAAMRREGQPDPSELVCNYGFGLLGEESLNIRIAHETYPDISNEMGKGKGETRESSGINSQKALACCY